MNKPIISVLLSTIAGAAFAGESIVGNIRVQALSPTLVRIEQKGPKGFEDRTTLTVVNRDWPGVPLEVSKKDGKVLLTSAAYQVEIPENAKDLAGITLRDPAGKVLYTISKDDLKAGFLPAPDAMPKVWVLPDSPRLIPAPWGAAAAPAFCGENTETSGWDMANQAQDLYLFIPSGDYAAFRKDFLKLTGPVPMPPLYAFGLWFSRYWPYSEQQSLDLTDEFRARGFPLDLFVCDTDWRVGASSGYGVNTNLFPDMARYLTKAHERNVRVMYNDHPEAQTPGALDPEEMAYRQAGIDSLLNIGADAWWYDKNWGKHLKAPDGLTIEFWGMVVYHDMTLKNKPERRPLIMSNADGIWGGMRLTPSHPAAHRYPLWWTGDTLSFWEELRSGIENGVNSGIDRMMPYINEDLGGHMLETAPELYTRWFQFGVFSPLPRPHSYPKTVHTPWTYGGEAEKICRDYAQLRYRLLPTIYTAVRRAYDNGTPLLQRCDLQWPQYPEAAGGLQYLFGDDLLIAPQCYSGLDPVPVTLLKTPDGKPGLRAEYFANEKFEGTPKPVRTDTKLFYDWKVRPAGVPMKNVSVRWTGTFGPVAETAEYEFGLTSKDGSKLWIDGAQLINKPGFLKNRQEITQTKARIKLEAGKTYPIKLEFFAKAGGECNLFFGPVSKTGDTAHQIRPLWLPPGRWQDVWTGETLEGPKTITVTSDLEHTPIYVRDGGMIFTTPLRMSSGTPVWDKLTVDAFVPMSGKTEREVYEDDGISNGYLKKEFSRTRVVMNTEKGRTALTVEPSAGGFLPKDFKRDWTVRLHIPAGKAAAQFSVNGKAVQSGVTVLKPADTRVFPFTGPGAAPGMKSGDVVELSIPGCPADKPLTVSFVLKEK
ncbi:MAG: TIM-barrel domain-containing protein [Kiritimatiellales bacterium]